MRAISAHGQERIEDTGKSAPGAKSGSELEWSGDRREEPFERQKNVPNWGSFSNAIWQRRFDVKMLHVRFFPVRKAL
jgi:hypothetical protein